jgi:hypothetical protein
VLHGYEVLAYVLKRSPELLSQELLQLFFAMVRSQRALAP